MGQWERRILWGIVVALALFTLIIYGRVGSVQDTIEDHTATLNSPAVEATVFPGVPVALAEHWDQATTDQDVAFGDHLWFTVQLTNAGQHDIDEIAVEFSLVPAITGVYMSSDQYWDKPEVVAGGTGETMVKVTFPDLDQEDREMIFIALQPDDFAELPFQAEAMRQWATQGRLYWKDLTVTADEATFVQHGLALPQMAIDQRAAKD